MIHYHGTPIGGKQTEAVHFLTGRHALVSFASPDQLPLVAEVCASFVLDNGAFTTWRQGKEMDFIGYQEWVGKWYRHPGFDWCLIPDSIDGSEEDNDCLLSDWCSWHAEDYSVPVWHFHESLDRLSRLCDRWRRVALGSSGKWPTPGTHSWWERMADIMRVVCDERGAPRTKLHGLRMLDPAIFTRLPLSSADSVNAGRNNGNPEGFGYYRSPSAGVRAECIATRIEAHNSAPIWVRQERLCDTLSFIS